MTVAGVAAVKVATTLNTPVSSAIKGTASSVACAARIRASRITASSVTRVMKNYH